MATIVFALPILPGKEDVDREMLERLNAPGPEKDAYVNARRAQGLSREQVWHQVTPDGTLAIIVLEGDDIMTALGVSATSDDPFTGNSESSSRTFTASTSRTTRRRTCT